MSSGGRRATSALAVTACRAKTVRVRSIIRCAGGRLSGDAPPRRRRLLRQIQRERDIESPASTEIETGERRPAPPVLRAVNA